MCRAVIWYYNYRIMYKMYYIFTKEIPNYQGVPHHHDSEWSLRWDYFVDWPWGEPNILGCNLGRLGERGSSSCWIISHSRLSDIHVHTCKIPRFLNHFYQLNEANKNLQKKVEHAHGSTQQKVISTCVVYAEMPTLSFENQWNAFHPINSQSLSRS